MPKRFETFNDGVLSVYEAVKKEVGFGAPRNTREKAELQKVVKLAYKESSKREKDLEFAQSRGRTLSLKVKTRIYKNISSVHKVMIEKTLYSIIHIDYDKRKREMYLYLEEERAI